jgi:hypothetical protein
MMQILTAGLVMILYRGMPPFEEQAIPVTNREISSSILTLFDPTPSLSQQKGRTNKPI